MKTTRCFQEQILRKRSYMKLHYYPETDSLYIDLSEKTSTDSQEISPGIVLDFDENGGLVGIDVDNASKNISLSSMEIESRPLANLTVVGAPAVVA